MGFTPIDESEILPQSPGLKFTPISEDEIAPSGPVDPHGTSLGILKGIAKAGTDVVTAPADLLFRGGMGALDYIRGKDTNLEGAYPSDYRDKLLNFISEGRGDESAEGISRTVGNLATVIAAPSQAKNIASSLPVISKAAESSRIANLLAKTVGYGTEGAAYGALFNAKDENLGEKAAEGAAWNIAVPAAFKVTGDVARGLKNTALEAARKLELSAFGAGKQAIKNAVKRMPDILDDSGNFVNPISESLEAFHSSGGGQSGMSGAALIKDLKAQTKLLVNQLSSELEAAQKLQKDEIVPEFNFTREFVQSRAGTSIDDAQKIAKNEILKTINNTDGTIKSLQAEKVKLGDEIKDTAWGEDAAGQLRLNILKRIRADLRSTIEKEYSKLTGNSPETVAKLNEEIGKRENLFPLFKDMLLSGESRTVLNSTLQSLRTSGGVGQLVIAGAAGLGAGGLPVAIPAVGLNMFLQSPAGKKALSNGLRSNVVKAPLEAINQTSKLGKVLGRVMSKGAESAHASMLSSDDLQNSDFKGQAMIDKPVAAQVIEEIQKDPVDHAIMLMESGGDPNAKNPESSASGLFQLIKKTAGALGVKDVFDPKQNYEGYKKLKAQTIKEFNSDSPEIIYAAHYLGVPTLKRWREGKSLTEEQQAQVEYLQSVLLPKLQRIYQGLTGKEPIEA